MSESRNKSGAAGQIQRIRERTAAFAARNGRRPRILMVRLHATDPDRDIKRISSTLADLGFDVDLHLTFQPPQAAARIAEENDVHLIGLSGSFDENDKKVAELAAVLDRESGTGVPVAIWGTGPKTRRDRKTQKCGRFLFFELNADPGAWAGQILDAISA